MTLLLTDAVGSHVDLVHLCHAVRIERETCARDVCAVKVATEGQTLYGEPLPHRPGLRLRRRPGDKRCHGLRTSQVLPSPPVAAQPGKCRQQDACERQSGRLPGALSSVRSSSPVLDQHVAGAKAAGWAEGSAANGPLRQSSTCVWSAKAEPRCALSPADQGAGAVPKSEPMASWGGSFSFASGPRTRAVIGPDGRVHLVAVGPGNIDTSMATRLHRTNSLLEAMMRGGGGLHEALLGTRRGGGLARASGVDSEAQLRQIAARLFHEAQATRSTVSQAFRGKGSRIQVFCRLAC